ncbi:10 TM acyl transferase domain found in Cas1p-domain-containing protein [Helicostylum pulchrum]|nr:10 TM acyl transferase domain found in Cas1p-domain-containing protein [Helicostylum pulchrum]
MGASSDSNILKSIKLGCIVTFTFIILGALGRFILYPTDRNRCSSLLERGQWIDDSYSQWQPSQCMMHTYQPDQITSCLGHSRILYIGDSIARQQFLSTVSLMKPKISLHGEPHVDRKYVLDGIQFEFWWDPYLNNTATVQLLNGQSPSVKPSLLVIESGAWHMHYLGQDYFAQWKEGMDRVFMATDKDVADALVLGPVELPSYDKLSKARTDTMTLEKIEKMNLYLKQKQQDGAINDPKTPIAVAFVWNQVSALASNMTEDGLHFNSTVTAIQTQIGLNYRCNDQLDKKFPMDTTCCYSYSSARWYQLAVIVFFLVWVPVGYYLVQSGKPTTIKYYFPTSDAILHALFVFGLCVVYMYLGDRTQLFGKIHKHFDAAVFIGLMIGTAVLGMLKLDHNNKKEGTDLGFLNRNQTDEWKGWMQLIILVYHFCGASGTSGIYNAVRVLVAAYLFQTGYGHFFYFYKKADFGIGRVLNVMVRLNLLTFVLQYFMDTNYLSYYFTPLVSFWFLVIWLVMYVGHSWNKTPWFMLLKLVLACILTTCLIQLPGVLEFVFGMLKTCFNVQWNAAEWRFRLALDAYIVYIGMLCAYAFIKISEHKLTDHARWHALKYTSFVVSAFALVWYFWFELSRDSKFVYNVSHPYISWIPILAFIVLRNANRWLRNTHSEFFAFIGKISLETFIGQFHMWLAADTKGLLVVLPPLLGLDETWLWWWLNLGVSSCLFIFVCYYTSQSTQQISGWICKLLLNKSSTHVPASSDYQPVPLLPTTGAASSHITPPLPALKEEEEEEEEIWDTSFASEKKPNRVILFLNDTRVKSLLILVAIGLLNKLC